MEKQGRKIEDTPENFAVLCWLLLDDVLNFYSDVNEIFFDRHFFRKIDMDKFDRNLEDLLSSRKIVIHHVDSIQNKAVNVADMVGGAVLAKETGKDDKFYSLIEGKIISNKKLNWPESKKRFLANKKLA